jgi:protease PrsW
VASVSHPDYNRLLMGSPLRRRGVCIAICAALLAVLSLATLIHLGLLASMRPDVASVFFRALVLSSVLAAAPLALLWFLDRRERETPWVFAATFLWGGLIATALSLPFNTAFFGLVDAWVAQHPIVSAVLGPDAAIMLAAPISAPIAEEIAKALGVLLVFWLLRAEFDNMRDGIVYGALVGLGFNWFEAALYVAQGYAETGVAPYGAQLGGRYALFGLGGHAMFTGLFGASLGLATQTRRRWIRILAPIAGLVLAIAAHMLNNALPHARRLRRGRGAARARICAKHRISRRLHRRNVDIAHHLPPALPAHGARGLAKRSLGTAGDRRGTGGGSRALGEPGRVSGDRRRSHAPDAPHRPDAQTSIGGANKRTA